MRCSWIVASEAEGTEISKARPGSMWQVRSGYRCVAYVASAAAAANLRFQSVKLEERGIYVPPPRFAGNFEKLKQPTAEKVDQLVWAVKHLEVDELQKLLQRWPDGAALIDKDDNTLFHLAASESKRCAAQPEVASQVISLLLQSGWQVVDQKNRGGERAEVLASRLDPNGAAEQIIRARSRGFKESSRAEVPLTLIGEMSPAPWEWQYPVQDEQRRSFAGVKFRAFPEETCARWMTSLVEKGQWIRLPGVPRQVIWYVSEDCADVPYRYSGLEFPAVIYPDFMLEIREELCKLCGIPKDDYPNSCNVNIYQDGSHEVGWHSDDEVMFQGLSGDTRILSLSLGAARDFNWRLQGTTETLGTVSLGDGDVATMEGLFQKHYKHAVPACIHPCGQRINLTFRWIKVKAHAADAATIATT